jgi:hypothetical protein
VRTFLFILILPFCLLLVSCRRPALPPIKDAEALRNDCANLYKQFPAEEIQTNTSPEKYKFTKVPKEKWPPSVAALNPDEVYKNVAGIFINPKSDRARTENGNFIVGYFVLVNPNKMPLPSDYGALRLKPNLGLIFKPTDFDNVYEVEQPMSIL